MRTRRQFLIDTSLLALATKVNLDLFAAEPNVIYPIGLGTYKTQLPQVLKAFYDNGGRLVDSSPMYGDAEEVLGELSAQLNINKKLFIATKVWTQGKEQGIRQMSQSLKKLKRQNLELMQIHNLVDWQQQLLTLKKWKIDGVFKYIGITHYSPSAFSEMASILRNEKLDFVQVPYSINELSAEKELIPAAAKRGVKVIANEPFDQGALFQLVKGKPLPSFAKEIGINSWAQYFLKFILGNKNVQFVIPATSNVDHLLDNMKAGSGLLPTAEQRKRMQAEFERLV